MDNTAQLIESYARRLAQTPHTGDESQDTETYRIVLRAMMESAEKHVYARALRRDAAVENPSPQLIEAIDIATEMWTLCRHAHPEDYVAALREATK